MNVTKKGNGLVTIEMTKENAESLCYVSQDADSIYEGIAEETDEDSDVRYLAGKAAETLHQLADAFSKEGIVG